MNVFDDLRDVSFDVVTGCMGYTATWTPLDGSAPQMADILYKDSTHKDEFGGNDYKPSDFRMEYRFPFLSGLRESVDAENKETVSIVIGNETKLFWVQEVETTYDGNTIIAYLKPKKEA